MPGDDPGLLVVTGSVASQLEDLSSEVLHDGSQVDGGTGTNTLGIVALAEEPVDTAHGELESSPVGSALCLSLDFAALSTSRHDEIDRELVGFRHKLNKARGSTLPFIASSRFTTERASSILPAFSLSLSGTPAKLSLLSL